jgi:hemoglobin-like flavoprotein
MNVRKDQPMTTEQKRLVRESFQSISDSLGPLALLFYARLFELDPALRPMFHQDIVIQGRKLMSMLTAVVENLDDLDQMAPALRAMGQRHTGYGVQPEHYQAVKGALLWTLGQVLDTDFYPEVKTAWTAVIDAISTAMQTGAAQIPAARS